MGRYMTVLKWNGYSHRQACQIPSFRRNSCKMEMQITGTKTFGERKRDILSTESGKVVLPTQTIWKSPNEHWEVQVFVGETAGRVIDRRNQKSIFFVVPFGYDAPYYTDRHAVPKYVISKMYRLVKEFCPWLSSNHTTKEIKHGPDTK